MAINWRQRAPILRLLAAVYAELGEETFKGRYGRIAKLFGNEATYDAIKSFFAKEIVKMADDLKTRNVDDRSGFNEIPHGQRLGVMRRPMRLAFDENDEEVIFLEEREVEMEVRHGRPKSSMRNVRARYESFDDGCDLTSPVRDTTTVHAMNSAVNSGYIPSAPPGPSFSVETQNQAPDKRNGKQKLPRKRPYSSIEESESVSQSFVYVTRQGQHRCALCCTELLSAEILRKHESLSELHLTKLKDPAAVSRGYATLLECRSLSDNAPQQQAGPNPALSNTGDLHRRDDGVIVRRSECREQSRTPHHRLGSTLGENETDTVSDTIVVAEPRRGQMQQSPPPTNTDAGTHESEGGLAPAFDVVEDPEKGESKHSDQNVRRNGSATPAAHMHPHIDVGPSTQQNDFSTAVSNRFLDGPRSEDVPPTWIAQVLLSSGMELLAKKCIEEHPELQAGFYKCIQDMQARRGPGRPETRDRDWQHAAGGLGNVKK